MSLKYS